MSVFMRKTYEIRWGNFSMNKIKELVDYRCSQKNYKSKTVLSKSQNDRSTKFDGLKNSKKFLRTPNLGVKTKEETYKAFCEYYFTDKNADNIS